MHFNLVHVQLCFLLVAIHETAEICLYINLFMSEIKTDILLSLFINKKIYIYIYFIFTHLDILWYLFLLVLLHEKTSIDIFIICSLTFLETWSVQLIKPSQVLETIITKLHLPLPYLLAALVIVMHGNLVQPTNACGPVPHIKPKNAIHMSQIQYI